MNTQEAQAARTLMVARHALLDGSGLAAAARNAGLSERSLRRRLRADGLKLDLRRKIRDKDLVRAFAWLEAGDTVTECAQHLGVHRTTLSRALSAARKAAGKGKADANS